MVSLLGSESFQGFMVVLLTIFAITCNRMWQLVCVLDVLSGHFWALSLILQLIKVNYALLCIIELLFQCLL